MTARFIFCLLAATLQGCFSGRISWSRAGTPGGSPADVDPSEIPIVSSILPAAGARGLTVTVTGEKFATGVTVTIGGVACESINVQTSSQLTCSVGKHGAGTADVSVQNTSSAPATLASSFTYHTFLYAMYEGTGEIATFAIDDLSGVLAQVGTSTAVAGLVNIEIHPSGKFLFAAAVTPGRVVSFLIDGQSGALTMFSSQDVFGSPLSLAIQRQGRFLFSANGVRSGANVFEISGDGNVDEVPGSPFAGFTLPESAAFSSDGLFLFASFNSGSSLTLDSASVGSSGSLAIVDSDAQGSSPALGVCAHPTLPLVYAVGGTGFGGWAFDSGGNLSPLSLTVTSLGADARQCTFSSSGSFLLATSTGDDVVSSLSVAADGSVSGLDTSTLPGAEPHGVVINHDSTFVYAAAKGNDTILKLSVDPSSGELGGGVGVSTGAGTDPKFMEIN